MVSHAGQRGSEQLNNKVILNAFKTILKVDIFSKIKYTIFGRIKRKKILKEIRETVKTPEEKIKEI